MNALAPGPPPTQLSTVQPIDLIIATRHQHTAHAFRAHPPFGQPTLATDPQIGQPAFAPSMQQTGVRNRYLQLGDEPDDSQHKRHDPRFDMPPEEVPTASIVLAVVLTVCGATALVLAWLHFTQQIFGKEQAVRGC